ncbi:MAG: hypothetical protein AB7I18_05240 [Candidatus Berkiella sp.]
MTQQGPSSIKLVCFDFDHTLVNGHFHSQLAKADSGVYANTGENGPQILQPNGQFLRVTSDQQGSLSPQEIVTQQYGASADKIQELIQTFGLKHPQEYAQAMKEAIDRGHKVAITSFTLFPEVAVPTLRAMFATLNLSQQQREHYISQICVVGGYPSNGATNATMQDPQGIVVPNPNFYGKEEHIFAAIRHFARQGVNINRANAILVDDSLANTQIAKAKGPVVEVPADNASAAYIAQINQLTAMNVNRMQVNPSSTQPPAPSKPNAANKQALPPLPPRQPNAGVIASRPIVNPTITKPTGAPPLPPQSVTSHPTTSAAPGVPLPPKFDPTTRPMPQPQPVTTLPPAPPVVTYSHTAPRSYMGKLPPRIPDPLTPDVVAQHLPKNPKLDDILSTNLETLKSNYQHNKELAHKDDKGLTNLFNKAKHAINHVKGQADKRTDQLANIINVFAELKKQQTMDPNEKAILAYAHLENIKNESSSSGMRSVCLQLQAKIREEFPNVVEKGVKAEFKDKAKELAKINMPTSKNDKKMR